MKNLLYTLILWQTLIIPIICQAQESYSIKGKIADPSLQGKELILRIRGYSDTTIVNNGYFEFNNIQTTGRAQIKESKPLVFDFLSKHKEETALVFFVDGSPVEIEGTSLSDAKVSSNKLQKEYENLMQNIQSQLSTSKSKTAIEKWQKADSLLYTYIEQNPTSLVAQILFIDILENKHLIPFRFAHKQWTNNIFQAFPDSYKKSLDGQMIGFILDGEKNVLPLGVQAPDFTLESNLGEIIQLSKYRGKYVFVDFWASWCKGCRMEHPHLREIHEKYKDKAFEMISVSLDAGNNARDKWTKAITDDKITWIQVAELKHPSTIQKAYGFMGVPFNVLVSPDGKIIGHSLRGEYLENYLEQVL